MKLQRELRLLLAVPLLFLACITLSSSSVTFSMKSLKAADLQVSVNVLALLLKVLSDELTADGEGVLPNMLHWPSAYKVVRNLGLRFA